MTALWSAVSWIVALPVLLLMAVLCSELLAALLPAPPPRRRHAPTRPSLAILVPAHNEASVIASTLDSLQPQLAAGDRLIVVADNCSDDTAAIAQARGATVIHRRDSDRAGKGFALDWGLRHLQRHPPQVVVTVDADTPVKAGAIEALARLAQASQRPVQADYVLQPPPEPEEHHRITAFAVLVKNRIRPAGLARLGLPCLLTGSGMAFPWPVIRQAELASGSLTEDLMVTAQLALHGHTPLFCAEARVTGLLPHGGGAAQSQRRRWEHGHLQTLFSQVPRLVAFAIRRQRLDVLALVLELAVPPLSLLALLWAGSVAAATLAGLAGASWVPTALLAAGAGLLAVAMLAVWARFGRAILPLGAVLALPGYVLAKVPLYVAFVTSRQTAWVRTRRSAEHSEGLQSTHDGRPPGGEAG